MKNFGVFCIKIHVLTCMFLGGTACRRPHTARDTRALPLVAVKGRLKIISKLAMALALGVLLASAASAATWEGVDESVVEKFAEQAGRPPQPPLINTDRGDLPLFLFLLAGAVGGFVGGYLFRGLFPPLKPRREGVSSQS